MEGANYKRYLTLDPKLEEVKNVVIEKASSRDFIRGTYSREDASPISQCWEEDVRMELTN